MKTAVIGGLTAILAVAGLTLAADANATDGMYQVGTDIAVGTYKIAPSSRVGGYYALCTDAQCQPGDGMIMNELVDGPEYMSVTSDVRYVKISRLNISKA